MQVVRHLNESGWNLASAVLTLGNFDGLHLGHRALVEGAVADAIMLGVPSVVLTFEPHPLKVLAPERAPKLILSHKDKLRILQSFAVSIVAVQPFDRSFANVEAEDFVRDSLVERLKARKIWVGRDFRFGRGRKAGVEELIRWGAQHGFEVAAVEPVVVDGERVSSSRIRQLLADGRVHEAKSLLGRYHFVSGRVVEGLRRGRQLGYPTANIAPRTEVLPQDGIYATMFHIGEKSMRSVSSVGRNPTFGEGPKTVESYIMEFDDNIYGQEVSLSFVERLRPEAKFESVAALIAQIDHDVLNARAVFQRLNRPPSLW